MSECKECSKKEVIITEVYTTEGIKYLINTPVNPCCTTKSKDKVIFHKSGRQ